jgi:hypothetical protein
LPLVGAATLIARMVGSMFDEQFRIARDAITRGATSDPAFEAELDFSNTATACARLHGRNVLRDYGARIRFTYDRYLEYLLSTELHARIRAEARRAARSVAEVAFDALRENLEVRRALPTAQRAVRRCLRLLLQEDGGVELVQRLALYGERGLTLASSVMGVIAMRQGSGIDDLEELLATLRTRMMTKQRATAPERTAGSRGSAAPAGRRPFPVIDVVYRLIADEEYEHWRVEQPPGVLERHLRLAVDTFRWGFTHPRFEIAAAATLYLYFLWKDPATRDFAGPITRAVISDIRRLRLWTPLFARQTRLIEHSICLLILTLPDFLDDRRRPITLDIAMETVRRLDLVRSPLANRVLGLGGLIGRQVRRRFARLPNPVNLEELNHTFSDPPAREEMRQVLRLLRTRRVPHVGLLLEQQQSTPNGLALELLAFSISVGFEIANDDQRAALIEQLELAVATAEDGKLGAHLEYAVSLALYHINYFGTRGDCRTVTLMQRLATRILVVHRGMFELHGKLYDFNIIGTFGRVRKRHAALFPEAANRPVFQFAIDALEEATRLGDVKYYLYVCQNVGLLGILDDPSDAFVVLGHAVETRRQDRAVFQTVVQSLSNIRALYRSRVDRWLLEAGDTRDPELYQQLFDEVVMRDPQFDLSLFHSWYFEHLMFNMLTEYHDHVGKRFIAILDHGLDQKDSLHALRVMLTGMFNLFVELVRPSGSSR